MMAGARAGVVVFMLTICLERRNVGALGADGHIPCIRREATQSVEATTICFSFIPLFWFGDAIIFQAHHDIPRFNPELTSGQDVGDPAADIWRVWGSRLPINLPLRQRGPKPQIGHFRFVLVPVIIRTPAEDKDIPLLESTIIPPDLEILLSPPDSIPIHC